MLSALSKLFPPINKLDSHMREVVEKGAAVFLLRIVGTGLLFIVNVVIARLFGAEGTGIYYLALTITTLAAVIGRFGLDNALLRFIATSADQNEWRQVKDVYRQSMALAASLSLLVTATIFGLAPWIASTVFSEPSLVPLLRLMSLSIAPTALLFLHAEALKALKKPVLATVIQAVGISLLNLLLIFPLSRVLGLTGLGVAYLTTQSLLLIVAGALWRYVTPETHGIHKSFDFRLLVKTSFPLLWVASMSMVMQWTDTIMLGIWVSTAEVGVYGAAVRTAMLTSFVLVAVNSIVAPKFATMYAQNDLAGLEKLAQSAARLMAALAFPVLLAFTIFPAWVLGFFGEDFTQGALALAILAVGQFVNVVTGSVGYLLMMTGHERLMQYNLMASALANVLLNIVLIPPFGIIGAALATSVTLAGMNIVSTFLVSKKLSITTLPISLREAFK